MRRTAPAPAAPAVTTADFGPSRSSSLRWVAEVLDHVVFTDPGHTEAKQLLADVFEQLEP